MSNIIADRHRNEAGEVDYHCNAGHHVYGENVLYRVNGQGKKTPSCRACKSLYRSEFRKRHSTIRAERARYERNKDSGPTVYDSNGNAIPLEDYLGAEKRSVPWNLLRPSAEASGVFDEFHEALIYTDVPCRGNWEAFTEYVDPRNAFQDSNEGLPPMPGRELAKQMCGGCPLLAQCDAYARADKPDFGIWGANRWLAGRIV